jgi:hypothetical protein
MVALYTHKAMREYTTDLGCRQSEAGDCRCVQQHARGCAECDYRLLSQKWSFWYNATSEKY